jgi:iron(III) transport system ATP-binding protein
VAVLSGGEQQRVAVARALVVNPAVLLFDEPLSNLDVALRIRTREEIRSLQRKTGITTIYVTHDQSEAMSLSHRIAVMREGIVEQVGTPAEVYESPSSPFVASFLGGATVHRATYDPANRVLQVGSATFHIQRETHSLRPGSLTVAIKPESIELLFGSGGEVQARIEEKEYLGFTTNFALRISGVAFRAASVSNEFTDRLAPGDTVSVRIHWSRCSIFPDGAE